MSTVKNYLSLIKFSHTIFAMPFALIGFFLGITADVSSFPTEVRNLFIKGTNPFLIKAWLFFLILLCMIFARTAAMAFNRYLDRNFDARNPRTAIREIPSGIISANSALVFTVVSSFLFIVTCYF